MTQPKASLVRRLTVGFVTGHVIGLVLFLLALFPLSLNDDVDQVGTGVVASMLKKDLLETRKGLVLRRNSSFADFAPKTPGVWFVARKGERTLSWGPVPDLARRVLAALPPLTLSAEFGNIGKRGRQGDMTVTREDADPASLLIAVGGVRPEAVTWRHWLTYLNTERYTLVPLGTALFTLLGAAFALPIMLRSMRPTARAVAARLTSNELCSGSVRWSDKCWMRSASPWQIGSTRALIS